MVWSLCFSLVKEWKFWCVFLIEGDIGYQLLTLRLKVVSCFARGVNRKMEVSMHANLRGCVNSSGWYLLCMISVEISEG